MQRAIQQEDILGRNDLRSEEDEDEEREKEGVGVGEFELADEREEKESERVTKGERGREKSREEEWDSFDSSALPSPMRRSFSPSLVRRKRGRREGGREKATTVRERPDPLLISGMSCWYSIALAITVIDMSYSG